MINGTLVKAMVKIFLRNVFYNKIEKYNCFIIWSYTLFEKSVKTSVDEATFESS